MLVLIDRGRVAFSGSREQMTRHGLHRERVQIAVAGSDDRLDALLARETGIEIVRRYGGGCEIDVPGGDDAAADLLARLVAGGIRVSSFHRRPFSLEELFLKLTSEPRSD